MGEVFLARDTKLDRNVAIKFLFAEFAKQADRLSRFVLWANRHEQAAALVVLTALVQQHPA